MERGRIFNLLGMVFILLFFIFVFTPLMGLLNRLGIITGIIIFTDLSLALFFGFLGYKKGDKKLGLAVSIIGGGVTVIFSIFFILVFLYPPVIHPPPLP